MQLFGEYWFQLILKIGLVSHKCVQLGNHTRPKSMNDQHYLGYSVVTFAVVSLKWQKLVENVDYILLDRQSGHSPEHFVWVFVKEKQVLRLMSWMVMQLRQS